MLPRLLICALLAVAMLVLPSVLTPAAQACDVVVGSSFGSRAVVLQARGGYGGGYGAVFAQDACGHNEVQVLAVRRRRVRQQVVVVQDVHHGRRQQVLVLQDGGGRRGGGGGLINLNFGGRRGR